MTWLGMAAMLLLLLFGAAGYARGFIKEVVSMAFLVLSFVVVWVVNPAVTSIIKEHTAFYTEIREECKEVLETQLAPGEQVGREMQMKLIDQLPLPAGIKKGLIANNNSEVYKLLSVERFADYVADYVATILTNGAGFVLSFTLSFAVLKIMAFTLNIMGNLPILRGVNRLAGGVLGLAKGLIVLWILGLAVTVMCNTSVGKEGMRLIQKDYFLSFLYEEDLFVKIFINIFYNV